MTIASRPPFSRLTYPHKSFDWNDADLMRALFTGVEIASSRGETHFAILHHDACLPIQMGETNWTCRITATAYQTPGGETEWLALRARDGSTQVLSAEYFASLTVRAHCKKSLAETIHGIH